MIVVESRYRTLLRVIVYRVIAMIITGLWTGVHGAIIIGVILTVVNYLLDRMWLQIPWGITINGNMVDREGFEPPSRD